MDHDMKRVPRRIRSTIRTPFSKIRHARHTGAFLVPAQCPRMPETVSSKRVGCALHMSQLATAHGERALGGSRSELVCLWLRERRVVMEQSPELLVIVLDVRLALVGDPGMWRAYNAAHTSMCSQVSTYCASGNDYRNNSQKLFS
eukprot:2357305-Amphidinium_carterae.1